MLRRLLEYAAWVICVGVILSVFYIVCCVH